ncbi:MAG: hypothetical protein ACR2NZ_11870 [Rubripirellula sp.]
MRRIIRPIVPVLLLLVTFAGVSHSKDAMPGKPSNDTERDESQFIVHEWGTFTTFSGSDGVYLEFRPLADERNDLPNFVFNRASSSIRSLFSKARIRGKVRMETPVTYFYTDRVRTVNVQVSFPQGLLTEFYPPVRKMLPAFDEKAAYSVGEPIGNSSLDWGQLTLIPVDALAPPIPQEDRARVAVRIADALLPRGDHDGHYAQARKTDSALVHLHMKPEASAASDPPDLLARLIPHRETDYFEKFLFYRGVGKFELPLSSVVDEDERVTLNNDGQLPMNGAVLVEVRDGKIKAAEIGTVQPQQALKFPETQAVTEVDLSTMVQRLLIAQGLYQKEASAMTETWKSSWFTEEGTRVLYFVPETLTDELLPLSVKPVPDQTLRVLVGRMELMSPASEQRLIQAVRRHHRERLAKAKASSPESKPATLPIPRDIQRFGRMMEPALVRVSKISRDLEIRTEAEKLISQLRSP